MSGTGNPAGSHIDTDYYRWMCECVGVAIISADRDLIIRVWNHAAGRLFGAQAPQMIGTSIGSVIPQEHREMFEHVLRRAVDQGESNEFEFDYRDAQGIHRELAVSVSPIVEESGARLGAVAAIRDITRRIAMKAELAQKSKMASLGEMAGAVAHHFNNILGGIVTSLDYAAASDYPTVKRRAMEQASRGLARATSLVNSLLAFAEGDHRPGDVADFTEIVSTLVDDFEQSLDTSRYDLIVEQRVDAVIPVPRLPVTTILRNVIQNAVDAMPEGGTLRIQSALDDDYVVIRVCDTGCGFDEATLSRIFEPFWTTKDFAASGPSKAIGLGLAVAHGAVHAVGGTITAESTVNGGSCFTIRIPSKPR